jgi:hypothetical protein
MDQSVLDAVKRWPDVPAVFGWLSLTARGEWKLHPLGDAQAGGLGQGISNTQILGFMDRNYADQPDGAWFFQNGPQRVYVRLDAAPLIVHIDPTHHTLTTHHATTIQHVLHWYCDETGQLYAKTDCGPARIDDRDLQILAEVLRSPEGLSLFDLFEAFALSETQRSREIEQSPFTHTLSDPTKLYPALSQTAPLRFLNAADIPQALHFIPNPGPEAANSVSLGRKITL